MPNENQIATPNPALWQPLNEKHLNGTWWRCVLAREMLTLRNAEGATWDAAGMRDRENTWLWVEDMAVGYENEDEDFMRQGAVNFWNAAAGRFNSWKRRHGLLSEPSLNDPSLTKSN
jgi:hypothetical protein